MRLRLLALLLLATASLSAQSGAPYARVQAVTCGSCAEWNQPRQPFRIFANSYFVGTQGLSAVLITSPDGHILLDGALPQSAVLIDANIRSLGFRTEDIKLIVNSHAHFDHAGGIAPLQRVSGAAVAASPSGAKALMDGRPGTDDPQGRNAVTYPAVRVVRRVADGETLRVGSLSLTAHFTPGHTPGSTTWTWRSCAGDRCLEMVYADSLTSISDDGFRFTGDATHGSLVESFRRSIATVAALPCDVLISTHPESSDIDGRLARRAASPGTDPFIDSGACRAYAARASEQLDQRVASESRR